MSRCYLTTAIARGGEQPDLAFALEVVRADVLAHHRRVRGDRVRFLTGAESDAYGDLRDPLALSYTEFAGPGRGGRHPAGVERLWLACAEAGDLYREAGTWYFRLSRHTARLQGLIGGGEVRVEPAARRDEVLDLLSGGLPDVVVSGPGAIPVPGDPDRFVAPWWDELATYVTSLGYGVDGPTSGAGGRAAIAACTSSAWRPRPCGGSSTRLGRSPGSRGPGTWPAPTAAAATPRRAGGSTSSSRPSCPRAACRPTS